MSISVEPANGRWQRSSPSLGRSLRRALSAATAYFLSLFAMGFALGTIRVLFVAPQFGKFAATIAELPPMIVAGFFLCRWSLRHWQVPHTAVIRVAMVLWFLALLFAFEAVLGAALFARSMADQWEALATPAGILGLTTQLVAALFPLGVDGPPERYGALDRRLDKAHLLRRRISARQPGRSERDCLTSISL